MEAIKGISSPRKQSTEISNPRKKSTKISSPRK